MTTNFDDMLSRAVRLFGREPIVCDHPLTTARINLRRGEVNIVHAHGTYQFYDTCNRRGEIEKRALRSDEQADADRANEDAPSNGGRRMPTIGDYLEGVLGALSRSPIVLGYAGWEHDVVMRALHRRLSLGAPLLSNLYWFVYTREEATQLPRWLTEHDSVCIVAPPEPPRPTDDAGPIREAGDTPTLPADDVLAAIINAAGIDQPRLFEEPIEVFESLIKDTFGSEDMASAYAVDEVLQRLAAAREHLHAADEPPSSIERLRELRRESQYDLALSHLCDIDLDSLDRSELREVIEAATEAGRALDGTDAVSAHDIAASATIKLLDMVNDEEKPELSASLASALRHKASALHAVDDHETEILAYDNIVARFGDADEGELQEQVARALLNKGFTLSRQGDREAAIEVYDEAVARSGDADGPELRRLIGMILVNKGIALIHQEDLGEAIEICDEVVARAGDTEEPELRDQVAKALVSKGVALERNRNPEAAIETWDDVVRRFAGVDEPGLREEVARALVNKGAALDGLGSLDAAIDAYDGVVERFDGVGHPGLRGQVARALVNKGITLSRHGNPEAAIETHDEVIRRFGDADEGELQEQVAKARLGRELAISQQAEEEAEADEAADEE